MNVSTAFPLVATICYIPLLAMVAGSRPWQKRNTLFVIFLASAMLWSLIDYLLRSVLFMEYDLLLIKAVLICFTIAVVQFHCFTSSFFAPGRGRWLVFAYGSLVMVVVLVLLGYIPTGVEETGGGRLYAVYGWSSLFMVVPLMMLAVRNLYVFIKGLAFTDNPAVHNQTLILILGIIVMTISSAAALFPWGRDFAISHFGNLCNACILTYAIIRHRLLDIRVVLRQGSAWLGLLIIGTVSFWLLLVILHFAFGFQLDLTASFVATVVGVLIAIFVYRLRGHFFELMNRVYQGSTYNYRQQLADFTHTIHNVFSLREQGGELLKLLTRAILIERACLLFLEAGNDNFIAQVAEPSSDNILSKMKLGAGHPVVKYLEREQKTLTHKNLAILPEFLGLWEQEREEVKTSGVEMFMPLISRDRLIAILVLGKKSSGKYSLEDLHLLEDVTKRVAVSMEKEYLREQLREREVELSVINRSSTIAASSLYIQEIYDSFVEELKKVLDVSWTAIVLQEEKCLSFLALSSATNDDHKVGENVAMEGSGTEWVITHKETAYEPDIGQESRFSSAERYIKGGLRSVVHLPLIARGEAIGSFVVASRQPYAYSQRQVALLEQLASQIAMPVENSRLYARTAKRARIDELTGLLNRRSLDEVLDNELHRHSRYGGVFSLAILDLDSFKKFNDTYGHVSGDRLLAQVGDIIKEAVRASDQAFRYGGDEFAIFLPETASEAAGRVLERVRRKISAKVESGDVRINASIGLASWPDDGVGQIDIIAAADMALYRAKRGGGNRINCASGALLSSDVVEQSSGERMDNKKS